MLITGVLFEIKIDGKKISPVAHSNVKQIELVQEVNSYSFLKIYFGWDTYFEFKDNFVQGAELQLSLPYKNELVPVFSGKISGLFAESDFVNGTSLRLEAKDYLFDLKLTGFDMSAEKYSLVRLIKDLSFSDKYSTKVEHVVDIQDKFIISGISKFDVLSSLCEEFGLYFYLKERSLSVFSLTHIPYKPFTLDITPILPGVVNHVASEINRDKEQKLIYLMERDNRGSEILQLTNEFKIGGNAPSGSKNGFEGNETVANIDTVAYYQSAYKDAFTQYFIKNSLNESYEFNIPGNPLIHPGMLLQLKDDHFFVNEVFVGKVIHKLDDLGYSSILECSANSRRE